MRGLVSIIMPVYNDSRYIRFCINSILNQTYKNWELLIVDDCSTDETIEIIGTYSDERIRLIKNERNIGLAACLNICIGLARGEFIARMDGDDIMMKERIEIQYNYLARNKGVDVVGSQAYLINERNEVIGYKTSPKVRNFNQLVWRKGFFIHPTVMARRGWFIKFLYNPSFRRAQDLELWIRSYQSSNFVILNEHFLFYRQLDSEYRKKYFNVYQAVNEIIKLHRDIIPFYLVVFLQGESFLKYRFYSFFRLIKTARNKENNLDIDLKNAENMLIQIVG